MLNVEIRHRAGAFALDVAFDAPAGVTVLFGRSGAGKSTVARAISGLLRADHARITVGDICLEDSATGVRLPPHRRRLGCVFQDGRLFPHMSVAQNLRYGAPKGADIGPVADMLGIRPLLTRRPLTLSGGERQRVAIGRALLTDPGLLIMDEPLTALDAARKAEILPYLERLRDEVGLPILYISHDIAEVARLATTLVLLDQGRVVAAGNAADVLADPAAVGGLGPAAGALIEGRVAALSDDGLTEVATPAGALWVPGHAAPLGAQLRLRMEATDVLLSIEAPVGLSALNVLQARVVAISDHGPSQMVQLAAGDVRLLARLTPRSVRTLGLREGVACHAIIKSVAVAG